MSTPENPSPEAKLPLAGWRIGLSISESPDLARLGFGEVHLQDAFVECARYLLAAGASLAYGGDLRERGYTEILFDLARLHVASGGSLPERIASFLSWPLYLKVDDAQRVKLRQLAEFHPVAPPEELGLAAESPFLPPDTAENRYIWGRCLTKMREEMNAAIHARVLLGGQITGYKGRFPGLAEEALMVMQKQMPLFLIGGFGGCSRVVIDAICGRQPRELTFEYHSAQSGYTDLADCYVARLGAEGKTIARGIDFDAMQDVFQTEGIAGLRNGLSEDENRRLFDTIHIPEMVRLVLNGLMALVRQPSRGHEPRPDHLPSTTPSISKTLA